MKEKRDSIIWTMWWQGEKNAPPIVKSCINSMRKYAGNKRIIVIDKTNYRNFVSLPDYIEIKRKNGLISLTHFSDIIRLNLLNKYGGLWMDSTILVTKYIPDNIFEKSFFTIKSNKKGKDISRNQWCVFLLGGSPNNIVFEKSISFFYNYWKKENEPIDYLLTDYVFYYIFNEFNQAYDLLCDVNDFKENILEMQSKLTSIDCDVYDFPIFNKLNWKERINNGGTEYPTLYQKILTSNGFNDDLYKNCNNSEKKYIKMFKSVVRHFKKFMDFKRIKNYGFKIQFYGLINSLLRTSESKCAYFFARRYQNLILDYLEKYYISL